MGFSTQALCGWRGVRAGVRCCGAIGAATGGRSATPESIAACVTEDVGQGSILLLHDADDYSAPDSWQRTAQALPRVLDVLDEQGIETVLP